MEIGGNNTSYPAGNLSNFTARNFTFRGFECASIEGVLQGLKSPYPHIQVEIFKMVGIKALRRGRKIDWKKKQELYWQGKPIKRDSKEYQDLLDELYICVFEQCSNFKKELKATGNATLKHSIGKNKIQDTVLTEREFCSRLMKLRELCKGAD